MFDFDAKDLYGTIMFGLVIMDENENPNIYNFFKDHVDIETYVS